MGIATNEQERNKPSLLCNKKGCSSSKQKKLKNAKFGKKHQSSPTIAK
jgi:hypothetical protein